ncbi:MAG: helicase [Verrucomicrobia bacterium]|nr:helicase [Verrucomicrobiota bacterium]
MIAAELTEAFLAKVAGWEAMKQARSLVERDQVLSSNWTPPLLKGVVQEGSISYRAGLVVKGAIDLENLCSCRASRQWGTICAHSVAVGLHVLTAAKKAAAEPSAGRKSDAPAPQPGTNCAVGFVPRVPPHPGPLPPGEGRANPVAEEFRRARLLETRSSTLPLPKGEGRGEGERDVQPPEMSATGIGEQPVAAKPGTKVPDRRVRRADNQAAAEPLEIFVVLPPNLPQALDKPRLTICLEGKWKKGRAPLNALPRDIVFCLLAEDRALLDFVEILADGETPGVLALPREQFASVLGRLVDHPRVSSGRSQALTVTASPWRVPLQASLQPSGEIRLTLKVSETVPVLIGGETAWAFRQNRFQPVGLPQSYRALFREPVQLPRARVPQFLAHDWPLLQMNCDLKADFGLDDFVLESGPPSFRLSLAGGLAQLQAQLQCAYGPRVFALGTRSGEESPWSPDASSPRRYFARDIDAERGALACLVRCGFTGPDAQGRLHLAGQDSVLNFFAREWPRLQREWNVTLEERLDRSLSRNVERIEPRFQVTPSGEQWFDFGVSFAAESGERFSPADIQRLILSSRSHTRLKSGRFAVIDTGAVEELQEVLLDCAPRQERGVYRLENRQRAFLESTLKEQAGWRVEAQKLGAHPGTTPSGAVELPAPALGALESVLRAYQKRGVAWLQFLRQNQFGGILADEMGLGKTLQTLAFLQSLADAANPESRKPSLVVCPTSLVFNWLAEAARFTPRLKALALHGPDRRELFLQIPKVNLAVTSYALIRRDAELYRDLEFDTVILDEAQHIKNRQTQNAQAVKAVKCAHRLVLTGTPLENSALDLWSIFDFLMPGYLGSASDFKERYEMPITRDRSESVQTRLARRVRPFILRRLKREVASDLPEKIEQVTFCELTDDQQAVYQQVLAASRREVLEAVQTHGAQKSRMVVLTALLRLRQICCDLRLLKLENVNAEKASGKLDLFQELLDEAIDGGHRVLVFSQFTSMLALIRERLAAAAMEFCYLDGATLNRAEVVGKFQSNPAIPVFLISLKAGGVGLNLTGADTVVHFDPWWNPAVEEQATDRAHRIGQTRVVTSYKLIARGTVEEKILNLQQRKRETLLTILADEESFTGALTWDELQELLA